MGSFVVEGLAGEPRLSGEVTIDGAKNAVLPVIAAALLVPGESTFENVPGISDIDAMARILEHVGAYVRRSGDMLTVGAHTVTGSVLDQASAKSLRASILLIGSVLARTGSVTFPHPGGDVIGERPIDIFVSSFEKLGATFSETADSYTLSAPSGLSGGEIFFRIISVTATEAVMSAATLAKGPVTLKNCAMEPEVIATAEYLISCGARIEGAGTPTIIIHPSHLTPPEKPFRIIPDRIEAASFLALGALAAKNLTLKNVNPAHLDAVIDALARMGVPVSIKKDTITLSAPAALKPIRLQTHEYPGFPTDAQSPMMILLTQAEGESLMIETIFDGRLNYTAELITMGASITPLTAHRVSVKGKTPLTAANIDTPDIRAGLAFLLAASIASGTSTIGNAHLIDRGYERIEEKLRAVGLSIQRVRS